MILKVTEQNGITIVEFVNVTRFTLASADEEKTEIRPMYFFLDCRKRLSNALRLSRH